MPISKQELDSIIAKVKSKTSKTNAVNSPNLSAETLTRSDVYGPLVPGLEAIYEAFRKDVKYKKIEGFMVRSEGNPTLRPTYVYDGDAVEFVSDGYSAFLLDSAEFLVDKTPLGRSRSKPKPRPWTSSGSDSNRPNLNNLIDFKNIRPIKITGSHDGSNFSALVFSPVDSRYNNGNIYVKASLLMPIVAAPLARNESVRFESDGSPLSPVYLFTGAHRSTFIGVVMPLRMD